MRTSHARLRKPCLEETLEASRAERPESNVREKRGPKPVTRSRSGGIPRITAESEKESEHVPVCLIVVGRTFRCPPRYCLKKLVT